MQFSLDRYRNENCPHFCWSYTTIYRRKRPTIVSIIYNLPCLYPTFPSISSINMSWSPRSRWSSPSPRERRPSTNLPASYNSWDMRKLGYECQSRNLPTPRNKYQRIQAIVDDDIAHREPYIIYNEDNDPDVSLAKAQDELWEEHRIRDLSVVEAKEEYEKERLISLKVELKTRKDKIQKKAELRLEYVLSPFRRVNPWAQVLILMIELLELRRWQDRRMVFRQRILDSKELTSGRLCWRRRRGMAAGYLGWCNEQSGSLPASIVVRMKGTQ